MNTLLSRIRAVGLIAWLRLVQSLNAIVVTLTAGLIFVNETYPHLIDEVTGKLSPTEKIVALAAWGGLIHYALRRAKKADTL